MTKERATSGPTEATRGKGSTVLVSIIPPAPSFTSPTCVPDARLRHIADRVHRTGPRVVYELLRELRDGRDFASVVESYARLENHFGDFIRLLGGDRLPSLRLVSS
jgi:hypothetical protein